MQAQAAPHPPNEVCWVDPKFPPKASSIGTSKHANQVKWATAPSIGISKLYSEAARESAHHTAIEPEDVTQGNLGDCWSNFVLNKKIQGVIKVYNLGY